MSANYSRPAFVGSNFKASRGSKVLAKEQAVADAAKVEKREKAKVRRRDKKCRWPEPHKCRGVLEAAHIVDASLGGDMHSSNLVRLCSWLHRRGPESIHGKQLTIFHCSPAGADGPLSFWRQSLDGRYYLVAEESAPFVIARGD